jgi:diadenosine tetraphosphate (Ap4A) HIT family hydrolase
MTDIDEKKAQIIFSTLLIIERYIRKILNPDKINLACLGNMVPHLHWHIIARYKNDRHFPNPIWGGVTNACYQVSNHLFELEKKLITSLSQENFAGIISA